MRDEVLPELLAKLATVKKLKLRDVAPVPMAVLKEVSIGLALSDNQRSMMCRAFHPKARMGLMMLQLVETLIHSGIPCILH